MELAGRLAGKESAIEDFRIERIFGHVARLLGGLRATGGVDRLSISLPARFDASGFASMPPGSTWSGKLVDQSSGSCWGLPLAAVSFGEAASEARPGRGTFNSGAVRSSSVGWRTAGLTAETWYTHCTSCLYCDCSRFVNTGIFRLPCAESERRAACCPAVLRG